MTRPDCPPWCKSNHDRTATCLGPAFGEQVFVRAVRATTYAAPRILIDTLTDADAYLFLGADDANRLAALLDAAGGDLARLIRLAVAVLEQDGTGS